MINCITDRRPRHPYYFYFFQTKLFGGVNRLRLARLQTDLKNTGIGSQPWCTRDLWVKYLYKKNFSTNSAAFWMKSTETACWDVSNIYIVWKNRREKSHRCLLNCSTILLIFLAKTYQMLSLVWWPRYVNNILKEDDRIHWKCQVTIEVQDALNRTNFLYYLKSKMIVLGKSLFTCLYVNTKSFVSTKSS